MKPTALAALMLAMTMSASASAQQQTELKWVEAQPAHWTALKAPWVLWDPGPEGRETEEVALKRCGKALTAQFKVIEFAGRVSDSYVELLEDYPEIAKAKGELQVVDADSGPLLIAAPFGAPNVRALDKLYVASAGPGVTLMTGRSTREWVGDKWTTYGPEKTVFEARLQQINRPDGTVYIRAGFKPGVPPGQILIRCGDLKADIQNAG